MMLNEERLSMQTEELKKDICFSGDMTFEEEEGEVEMLKEEWLLKVKSSEHKFFSQQSLIDRQTDRYIDRQTDRQTDRQIDR